MIHYLPDGRIFFDPVHRLLHDIPPHFHVWSDWEWLHLSGQRCYKCGLVHIEETK